MSVCIFKVQREFDWYAWLCPRALERWTANGWTVRETKEPPHGLSCDDATEHGCCAATTIEGETR